MTARDLLQQRTTLANGDTVWRPSSLLNAVTEGKIAVMDGLHRLNTGTLFTVQKYGFPAAKSLHHVKKFNLFSVLSTSDKRNCLMDPGF